MELLGRTQLPARDLKLIMGLYIILYLNVSVGNSQLITHFSNLL